MNYPEDMNEYNDDPRSPAYDDSKDRWIESRVSEIAVRMLAGSYELNGARYTISDVIEFISGDEELTAEYEEKLTYTVIMRGLEQLSHAETLAKWMQEQAEKVAAPLAELELAQGDEVSETYLRQAS